MNEFFFTNFTIWKFWMTIEKYYNLKILIPKELNNLFYSNRTL